MADERSMKEIKSPEEIPDFETEEDEAEFWAQRSLGEEYLKEMGPIPESVLPPAGKPQRARSKPIGVRFDDETIERLKALADRKHKGYQTLLKEFVTERLYEEEKREGIVRKSS